jgi:tetratricopeptide (TPR) repeat protein/transcriptional regulator with XRE-family HTH domain
MGSDTPVDFGQRMAALMSERGLSLTKLAAEVHYDKSTLSRIRSAHRLPTAEQAAALDRALDAGGVLIALHAGLVPGQVAQLPAALPEFVGRDRELTELARAVDEHPGMPMLIDGPPGAGKTALALRFAHQIAYRYSGGQLYVDLRGHSPEARPLSSSEVLERFLTALGVPSGELPTDLEERAARWRTALAGRPILVVLDNAADSRQVEPLLPGTSTCAVVVTSRERLSRLALRTGAYRVTVGVMNIHESLALLRTRVPPERAAAEPGPLVMLANRCGHLPLALRIAAERVAIASHHTVADLVAELEDDSPLDALDLSEDTAVRTVFAWSYRRLGAEEARLFRLLGLHRLPDISIPAAAALVGRPQRETRRLLDRLESAHLIQNSRRDGFRMHDLIGDYAQELANEGDPMQGRAAIARLIAWYLHTLVTGHEVLASFRGLPMKLPALPDDVRPLTFATPTDALAWCDTERANFVPIIQLAADRNDSVACWQMAVALWNFLLVRKPYGLWLSSHRIALAAATAAGETYGEAWVMTNLAEACRRIGDYEESDRLYTEARRLRKSLTDTYGLAWATLGSAFLAVDRVHTQQAHDFATRALALFQNLGDQQGEAIALGVIGDVHHQRGQREAALERYEQAAKRLADMDARDVLPTMLLKCATIRREQGCLDDAMATLHNVIAGYQEVHDWRGEAGAHATLAALCTQLGRTDEADAAWERAVTLYEERGEMTSTVRATLVGLAERNMP